MDLLPKLDIINDDFKQIVGLEPESEETIEVSEEINLALLPPTNKNIFKLPQKPKATKTLLKPEEKKPTGHKQALLAKQLIAMKKKEALLEVEKQVLEEKKLKMTKPKARKDLKVEIVEPKVPKLESEEEEETPIITIKEKPKPKARKEPKVEIVESVSIQAPSMKQGYQDDYENFLQNMNKFQLEKDKQEKERLERETAMLKQKREQEEQQRKRQEEINELHRLRALEQELNKKKAMAILKPPSPNPYKGMFNW